MTGNMVNSIFFIEALALACIFILSFYEFLGVYTARLKKLTKNVSRMVTHAAICLITLILGVHSFSWVSYIRQLDTQKWIDATFINWPFLLTSVTMGFLLVYEFLGIHYARLHKLTKNVSRLITHFIMLLLFCLLVVTSVMKWNIYVEKLKEPLVIQSSTAK